MMAKVQGKGKWLEVSIGADPRLHEAIASYLFDLDCSGVAVSDERPWEIKAYLPAGEDTVQRIELLNKYLQEIQTFFPQAEIPRLQSKSIEEQDWGETWKKFFRQERVTHLLTIVPAWERPSGPVTEKIILMDPGPAFGTGKHPSTRMCLRALENMAGERPWNMLDVGTGSGILAIYSAILGANRIVAIDIDPEALRWARRNAMLNKVQDKIIFSSTSLTELTEEYHVVAANIVYETILELKAELARVTCPGGTLILSGLLLDQSEKVKNEFCLEGLSVVDIKSVGEWAAVILNKKKARGR